MSMKDVVGLLVGAVVAVCASLWATANFSSSSILSWGHPSLLAGVAVAALASASAHVLVVWGLTRRPDDFLRWWGLSLAVKGFILMTAWGIAALTGCVPIQPFVWSMASGVVCFAHLGIWRLLRLSARAESVGREAKRG